ncbi:MAG: hypothetical protein DHS20C02_09490 [Micavibrio sp.]|nr:MAG: hypothetical protein DHS20C02_09490 [Micavibrio sp.]
MKRLSIYQVDAFTNKVFGGNPAAVCPLESWLPDETLQKIAHENNLSETAFFVPDEGEADYHLRWLTPTVEVDLCGHATLASAYVIFNHLGFKKDTVSFRTRSGLLYVHRKDNGLMMDFPAWEYREIDIPDLVTEALGHQPDQLYSGVDWVAVYDDPDIIAKIDPDLNKIMQLEDVRAIVVTAKGTGETDFISRFFGPRVGVPEDPVTGSAHCILTPIWAEKLGKTKLKAKQVSARGGELICELKDKRVEITGQAVLYMEGTINV